MRCDQIRLDEYLDGTLAPAEVEAVRAHVERCSACREQLEELRELNRLTEQLARSIDPQRDLWPGIAAEIDRRKVVSGGFGRPLRSIAIVVAAAAVVVLAVMIGYLAGRQDGDQRVVQRETPTDVRQAAAAQPALAHARAEFDRARAELLAALDARRNQLSPDTLRVVESNLGLIDAAIEEIVAALDQDPDNPDLAHRLTAVYRQQIELLQRATRLPAET